MMEQFFSDLLNKKKGKNKEKTLVSSLYAKPKRDRGDDEVHFPHIKSGNWQQADLLTLPNDGGYNMALVVVDVGSRKVDAVALKTKSSADVLKGLQTIWKRGILTKPKQLTTDQGTEFHGDVITGLKKIDVGINFTIAGRHRQVALVERKNQTIGKLIHKLIVHDEEATGHATSAWVKALPTIIKAINMKVEDVMAEKKKVSWPSDEDYKIDLLDEGTKVRVQLDNPEDVNGHKLHGKFRSGDIRWNPEIRTIKYVLMKPNQPPLYLLDGNYGQLKVQKAGYTRNQLQVVSDNETKPQTAFLAKEGEQRFEVEKLLERKVEKGTVYFLVKWRGYPKSDATWERRNELVKDVPQLIKQYEKKLKLNK